MVTLKDRLDRSELKRIIVPGHPMFPGERRRRLGRLILAETAKRLPERLRFYVLIDAGVKCMRPNETVPEVPFTVVLERFGKPESEWRN